MGAKQTKQQSKLPPPTSQKKSKTLNLPPPTLQKSKVENENAKGKIFVEARRSTGQRILDIAMGTAAHTKPLRKSPPRTAVQKSKIENGSVKGSSRFVEARRSTGQRFSDRDLGSRIPRNFRNDTAGQERKLAAARPEGNKESGSGCDGSVSKRFTSLKVITPEGELVDGWPKWLTDNIPGDVLASLVPRSAESYVMLDKIGHGTYSNVYKARDKRTGTIVALKKVRFDTSDPESVKFMAREIRILKKLDHPNIVKLEGLATSRMHYSLYLVLEYMQSDLSRVISHEELTEPQVKCYMQQLLLGVQHCHERGILHRDLKCSNVLIDQNGVLKIADFGLANYFDPRKMNSLTSRVVTLWYRAPELLLGATDYGVGIDLWSAGCVLAEMFVGRPIMPGRTEVEQLHRIFKLCGTPSEEYWKSLKASAATFRPPQSNEPKLGEAFRDFPASFLGLLKILLALNPGDRGSASSALQNEFFSTSPLACDLSGLPVICKENDGSDPTNEPRRREWSQTPQECQKKETATEKPKGDSSSSKEEAEKRVELNNHQGGSASTSTSSSLQQKQQESSSPSLCSPDPSLRRMFLKSDAEPISSKNTKNRPPLPKAKSRVIQRKKDTEDPNMYRLDQVRRSVSTKEYQNSDQIRLRQLKVVNY